jgi:uncharacterized protein YdaU (DUF1376 family)
VADLPYLQWSPRDYLSDTRELTTLQHGAYHLLLWEAWLRPSRRLPDDDTILARLTCMTVDEWLDIKDAVMAKWQYEGRSRTWKHKRLEKEAERAHHRSKLQADRAAKRWSQKEKDDAVAMPRAGAGAGAQGRRRAPATGAGAREKAPISPTLWDDTENEDATAMRPPHASGNANQNQNQNQKSSSVANATGDWTPFDDEPSPAPRAAHDFTKAVWDSGKHLLQSAGVKNGQAGSLIGKWRKEVNDDTIMLRIIADAEHEQPSNPVEWITAAIRNRKGTPNGRNAKPARDRLVEQYEQLLAEERSAGYQEDDTGAWDEVSPRRLGGPL